ETIYSMAKELLEDQHAYEKMAKASNPYGDGEASRRIVEALINFLSKSK
ncbi:UDP-N-acetylglucosamine 2-epimerase (non-hydrolyzing), partial [Butyricicoccus sp. 1XD8-22]